MLVNPGPGMLSIFLGLGLLAAEFVWARRLMDLNVSDERCTFAMVQLSRRTGDRYRDVSDPLRQSVISWMTRHNAAAHYVELIRQGGLLHEEEQRYVFGEILPRGLRID